MKIEYKSYAMISFDRFSDYLEGCMLAERRGYKIIGGGCINKKWFLKMEIFI